MKTNRTIAGWLMLAALSTLNLQPSTAHAQGTAFTYQGRLNAGGNPTTGIYDLQFTLFDSLTGGGPAGGIVAGPLTNSATGVTNGLFCVTLDFGSGVFTGPNRWLEIAARTNGTASFTTLAPRQQLTPAPYAIYAESANAAALSGTIPLAQLPGVVVTNNNAASVNLSGSFTGNGSGLTALDAGNIAGGTLNAARLPANVALLNADQTFSGNNVFNLPLGIGVTPVFPLDVQAVQAVGHFTSTYSYYGSVIELRNTTSAGSYMLGSINFNDAYGSYPGQIAYLTSDAMSFRVGGEDNLMLLDPSGLEVQGDLTCNNLYLSTAAIYSGGSPFIHADGDENFSAGIGAGNFMGGGNNTAVGYQALLNDTGGSYNTAIGDETLTSNTNGSYNTAIGGATLKDNTTGSDNTAIGLEALMLNTNGSYNTAIGQAALWNNTSGSNNIALGYQAGFNLTAGSSNIDIGNQGFSSDINLIRIGSGQTQTYIAGIINGNGGGLTNLNAVQLTGTIPTAQLPGVVVTNNNATSVNLSGSFTGNGSALTSLNANNLASGTVPLARMSGITGNQLDAATWQLATNLNGGIAALASNVVSGIAITNAFITNSVVAGNGAGLTNVPGTLLAVYSLPVGGGLVANAPATTWTKVADLGSFTKQNGATLELTFNGRLVVGSWAGGLGGADFELRLDNTASSVGHVRATVMSTDNATFGIQAGMTGFFTGYNAGSHTVSMWVYGYTGSITNIAVNPGYFYATHVAIKEFK